MPVQQNASFFKKLGAQVATAHAEHVDKPVDTGNRRLPPGIRDGIAKLVSCYTKVQDADDGKTPKGEIFFRAAAMVVSPVEFNKEKVEGLLTSVIIPLCAVPEKGKRKATSFSKNWYDFQNWFKLVSDGAIVCRETDGAKIEQYYLAAMRALVEPMRLKTNPVYVSFSTRGFTPEKPTPEQPNPTEYTIEEWHGVATWNGKIDPAAGVTVAQPPPMTPPPSTIPQTATQQAAAPPPTTGAPPQYQPSGDPDPADVVASLVQVAMSDPDGATEEGAAAAAGLEDLAWAKGWTKEQTNAAADWEAVGAMALEAPQTESATPTDTKPMHRLPHITVGSKWMFAKRDRNGAKLKDAKGVEFPAVEVEVTFVGDGTCTVKATKTGKDVIDIRSKKPVEVKFEWLEPVPF